jgi:hypothetical protein
MLMSSAHSFHSNDVDERLKLTSSSSIFETIMDIHRRYADYLVFFYTIIHRSSTPNQNFLLL